MPLPAITYTIVTIGLIAICIYLIYALVLPKFSILSNILVLGYELHIGNYTVVQIKSNTNIRIENITSSCAALDNNTSTIYIICDCQIAKSSMVPITVCAGSVCKTFMIRCPR